MSEVWIVTIGGENYAVLSTKSKADDVVNDMLSDTGIIVHETDIGIEQWTVGEIIPES